MQNWITKTAVGAFAFSALALTSCKKDEVQATLTPNSTPALSTASPSTLVLTQNNATQTAVTYNWTPISGFTWANVDHPYNPAVTYSIQLDKKGNNFASPVTLSAGNGPNTAITVASLDAALLSLGLKAGTATDVEARLVSSYASNVPLYSNALPLNATVYNFCAQPAKAWGLVGPAGPGWPGGKIDYVMQYDCDTKTYTYTGPLTADKFKFRFAYHWTTNLGGTGPTAPLAKNGADIAQPTAGTFTVTLYNAADTTALDKAYYTIK